MSQFTSPRGQNSAVSDPEVVFSDLRAVLTEDHGLYGAEVQGNVVTIVWPVGNASKASIFHNGEKLYAGLPCGSKAEKDEVREKAEDIVATITGVRQTSDAPEAD